MGKSKKHKYSPSIPLREILDAANNAPITYVLKGARAMQCNDYAIKHYYNKRSKLYKNSEKARNALKREIDNCMLHEKDELFINPIERLITSLEDSGYKFKSERKPF